MRIILTAAAIVAACMAPALAERGAATPTDSDAFESARKSIEKARELETSGRMVESLQAYCAAVRGLGKADPAELARAKEGLSGALTGLGLYPEASVWARSALSDWRRAEARGLTADECRQIVALLMRLGDYGAAARGADELSASKDATPQTRLWAREQALRCQFRLRDWASAVARAESILAGKAKSGHRTWARLKLAEARLELRDFDGAKSAYRQASTEATGSLKELTADKIKVVEALARLYAPVEELTAALTVDAPGEMRLVLEGGGLKRVRNVRLASGGSRRHRDFDRLGSEMLRDLAAQLVSRRKSGPPLLGVTITLIEAAPPLSKTVYDGVIVTSVDAGSPAEKMGLSTGDRIIAVNGSKLGKGRLARARMLTAIRSMKRGTTITLTVRRGATGKATVSGVLKEYPSKD